MYEDIIKKIEEKERELGIIGGYKNWNNEMFEFIHKNKYDTIGIYDIIIGPHIKMQLVTANNMDDAINKMQKLEGRKLGLYEVEGTYVYKGTAGDCDVDFCKENNIPVIDFGQPSGTFVITDGSLGIAYNNKLFLPIENMYIYNKIKEYLGATPMGNDYLIKGYKVAGLGYTMGLQVQHLSFTVDVDLIKNICKKEMKKVPKGITELTGITREQFVDWLKTWLVEE